MHIIRERLPTKNPDGDKRSPFKRRKNEKPNLKNAKVFGCLSMCQKAKAQRKNKLESRAWKGVFVGVTSVSLHKVYSPEMGEVKLERNVQFDEATFPSQNEEEEDHVLDSASATSSELEDYNECSDSTENSYEDMLGLLEAGSDFDLQEGSDSEWSDDNNEDDFKPDFADTEDSDTEVSETASKGAATSNKRPVRTRRPPARLGAVMLKCLQAQTENDTSTVNEVLDPEDANE